MSFRNIIMINNVKQHTVNSIPNLDGRYTFPPQKNKTITILGSSRSSKELENAMQASADITRYFVENGYNVVHGCGSEGIMGEVYNTAVKYSQKENGKPVQNLAIIKQPLWGDENLNDCVIVGKASSEAERIEKFGRVSDRFLIFPGGTTTMQEATTLIQNNKYPQKGETKTIVLFGKEFWSGLAEQYKKLFEMKILKENPIGKLFHIADSKEEVIRLILKK